MALIPLLAHDELYMLDLSRILYLSADDHYTQVYYSNGTDFMVPFGLAYMEQQLASATANDPLPTFRRLGRKYIVNLTRIFRLSTARQQLFLTDDTGAQQSLRIPKPVLRDLHTYLVDTYLVETS